MSPFFQRNPELDENGNPIQQGPPPMPALSRPPMRRFSPDEPPPQPPEQGPPPPPMAQQGPPQLMASGPPSPPSPEPIAPPSPPQMAIGSATPPDMEMGPPTPPHQAKVTTPQTDKFIADSQALQGKKPSTLQNIAGGLLSMWPATRHIDVHPGLTRQRQNLGVQQLAADEERKAQQAQSQEELKRDTLETNAEGRRASVAQRTAAMKPPQTITERIREAQEAKGPDGQSLYTPDEIKMIGAGWKPPAEKAERYGSSPLGIYSTSTGQVTTPAPDKPAKPQYNGRERMALQAVGLDPDAENLPQDKVAKALQSLRPITNNTFTPPAALDKAPPGSVTIDQVPDAVRGRVQQVLDYRGDLPASSRNNPTNQAILYWANKIDPTLDASTFPVRKKLEAAYSGGGQQGQAITALNTAILHLGTLDKAVSTLDNAAFQRYNTFANWLNAERGNPQAKPFVAARTAFSEEVARALKGGVATEGEVNQWNKILDESDSPAKARTTIRTVLDLVEKRALAQQDYYTQNMGRPPRKPFVSDRAQAVIDGLKGSSGESQRPSGGSAQREQHSPSTGQYRYTLDGGQTWQPGRLPRQ